MSELTIRCTEGMILNATLRPRGGTGRRRLEHWGERDLDAALEAARSELGVERVFLVGHSLGGQLAGLAPSSEKLSGMVFVGSCAPYPSRYALRDRLRIELMWRVLVPLLGSGPTFPMRRLGLGSSDLPTSVVRRWRDWGLTRDYLFDPRHGVDVARYARLRRRCCRGASPTTRSRPARPSRHCTRTTRPSGSRIGTSNRRPGRRTGTSGSSGAR